MTARAIGEKCGAATCLRLLTGDGTHARTRARTHTHGCSCLGAPIGVRPACWNCRRYAELSNPTPSQVRRPLKSQPYKSSLSHPSVDRPRRCVLAACWHYMHQPTLVALCLACRQPVLKSPAPQTRTPKRHLHNRRSRHHQSQ